MNVNNKEPQRKSFQETFKNIVIQCIYSMSFKLIGRFFFTF